MVIVQPRKVKHYIGVPHKWDRLGAKTWYQWIKGGITWKISAFELRKVCLANSRVPVVHRDPLHPLAHVQVFGAVQVPPFWQGRTHTTVWANTKYHIIGSQDRDAKKHTLSSYALCYGHNRNLLQYIYVGVFPVPHSEIHTQRLAICIPQCSVHKISHYKRFNSYTTVFISSIIQTKGVNSLKNTNRR